MTTLLASRTVLSCRRPKRSESSRCSRRTIARQPPRPALASSRLIRGVRSRHESMRSWPRQRLRDLLLARGVARAGFPTNRPRHSRAVSERRVRRVGYLCRLRSRRRPRRSLDRRGHARRRPPRRSVRSLRLRERMRERHVRSVRGRSLLRHRLHERRTMRLGRKLHRRDIDDGGVRHGLRPHEWRLHTRVCARRHGRSRARPLWNAQRSPDRLAL